jgi:hypothetical protein
MKSALHLIAASRQRQLWMLYCALLFITTFMPVYIPLHAHYLSGIYSLRHQTNGALAAPPLFLLAFICSFIPGKYIKWAAISAASAGIFITFCLCGILSTDPTPRIRFEFILSVMYVFVPSIWGAVLLATRRPKIRITFKHFERLGAKYKPSSLIPEKRTPYVAPAEPTQQLTTVRTTSINSGWYARRLIKQRANREESKRLFVASWNTRRNPSINHRRGMLWSVLGAAIGLVLWIVTWNLGLFVGFLAGYAVAGFAIAFYKRGTRSMEIDRRTIVWITALAVVGTFIGYFGQYTFEILRAVLRQTHGSGHHQTVFWPLGERRFWRAEWHLLARPNTRRIYIIGSLIAELFALVSLLNPSGNLFFPAWQMRPKKSDASNTPHRPDDWKISF